jgi:hypothetical protein
MKAERGITGITQEIVDLQKGVLIRSKELAKKLDLLNSIASAHIESMGRIKKIQLPLKIEETKAKTFYKCMIKESNGIHGSLFIPIAFNVFPDEVLLKKAK